MYSRFSEFSQFYLLFFYYLYRKYIKKKCYDNKLIRRLKIMLRYIIFFISVFLFSCSQTVDIWGIERSGFFNGRGKWAKSFENQTV